MRSFAWKGQRKMSIESSSRRIQPQTDGRIWQRRGRNAQTSQTGNPPLMHLRRRDGPMPAGGFPFTDPKTGMKFAGMEATFKQQVHKIVMHRLANPLKYPTSEPEKFSTEHVAAELDLYTCQRLGNSPNFCTDGSINVAPVRVMTNRFCPDCGSPMMAVYCQTCSRAKVVAYKCQQCGKELPAK